MRHVVFCSAGGIGGSGRRGQSGPGGCSGSAAPPHADCHGGLPGRSQNRRSADPDRNAGKVKPVSGSVRRERNDRFALRRRTSRNAVGITGKSSTECANAIMLAHTVNQSAVVPGDLQVPSHGPLG